jgi:hypothetical protein
LAEKVEKGVSPPQKPVTTKKSPLGHEGRHLGEDGDRVRDGVAAVRLAVNAPGGTEGKRLITLVPNAQRSDAARAESSEMTSTGFHMELSFLLQTSLDRYANAYATRPGQSVGIISPSRMKVAVNGGMPSPVLCSQS